MGVRKCEVCGGIDPYPKWFCLRRLVGEAKRGEPCSYAIKGPDPMKEPLVKEVRHD